MKDESEAFVCDLLREAADDVAVQDGLHYILPAVVRLMRDLYVHDPHRNFPLHCVKLERHLDRADIGMPGVINSQPLERLLTLRSILTTAPTSSAPARRRPHLPPHR